MYLKRLTISGFKSFAGKTELQFEPGITAIVGPNGSGKSNIADAVRWALGEQSVKQLRMKKSDELVFAGTAKRSKGSMAEVSLLMDNSDGSIDLDFSEIELSRVIYRSGETEYRINGRKARLAEIQHLLSSAGFGQNSYTVIGQGMIDSFIMSTPAERKLLFDEASGIRQYELKRDQARKKLEATDDNLRRVNDIIHELEPRLVHLSKSVEHSQDRQKLVRQLAEMRAHYVVTARQHYAKQRVSVEGDLQRLSEEVAQHSSRIKELEEQKAGIKPAAAESAKEVQGELRTLEIERDELTNEVSVKKAELQFLLEKHQQQEAVLQTAEEQETAIAKLKTAAETLQQSLKAAKVTEKESATKLDTIAEQIRKSQAKLASLRDRMRETSSGDFISHALSILRHAAKDPSLNVEQIRDLIARAGRLLLNASFGDGDVAAELRAAQQELSDIMHQREKSHRSYTEAVIKVRSLEIDISANAEMQSSTEEQLRQLHQVALGRHQTQEQIDLRRERIKEIEKRLEVIGGQIERYRNELANSQANVNAESIFALATDLESKRHAQGRAEVRIRELKEELESIQVAARALENQVKAWFGAEAIPETSARRRPLAEQEREIAVLEGRVAENSENDATIAEEHQEVAERHRFLTSQVADLKAAKADLEDVITQLDKLIKAKFEAGFEAIARQFSQSFEQLFGGGSAGLSLRTDENGTYGIEITATPPGKRITSLSALSGGERSLTGIALLAAILETNPSPFVVLDEVDAALDEANSSRLGGIMQDIAHKSQLLVITHNRAVMQAAHSIFGVTMDDHHVSRLLSIRFEEAKELAAAE